MSTDLYGILTTEGPAAPIFTSLEQARDAAQRSDSRDGPRPVKILQFRLVAEHEVKCP